MADSDAKDLIEQGDKLFADRLTLMSFWQEIAWNFYLERADFTVQRVPGNTFAENLMTSYPLIARRELGDAFSSMLRPTAKHWFKITIAREDKLDYAGRRWLAWATGVQRRAMYDRAANFRRATKEGDHDFAAFGQCVISKELSRAGDVLLFRCWHLRDVAWRENAEQKIDTIHRKWKLSARDAVKMFPKAAQKLQDKAEKNPFDEVELRHVVLPSADWGGKKFRQPFVSIFINMLDQEIVEETGSWTNIYTIPRWVTVSGALFGTQYAYSPATVATLPDARLMQAMTLTLLEAGERFTNPPMIATQQAIRGDVQLYAGGITWVDSEYDERLGEVLRPLTQDKSGMPLGREMVADLKAQIAEGFYLNKLTMPSMGGSPEMTAFEVGQRVQEYIRQALPLFEPMEVDYNGSLCEDTFELLLRNGAFGPHDSLPQSLRGQQTEFEFESPLSEAISAQKGQKLIQGKQLIAQVVDVDPLAAQMVDVKVALRDALLGIGVPPRWMRSPQDVAKIEAASQAQAQGEKIMQGMERGSTIVKNLGGAQVLAGNVPPNEAAAA